MIYMYEFLGKEIVDTFHGRVMFSDQQNSSTKTKYAALVSLNV